jgi:2-methylcitrate dehydratase PrpD
MNLLDWAKHLCGASASPELVDLHVRDAIAAFVCGLATHEGLALAGLYDERTNRIDMASLVAGIARLSESDDIHLASCVTPGAAVIAVALAFAGNSDRDNFTRAVSAGYSAGLQMGLAMGGAKALTHGVWPTLLAAPPMAAVTASCLAGHDPRTVAHAIALSLSGASGRLGRPAGTGRWFTFAEAVAKGIRAAAAAGRGVQGDLALLSSPWLAAQAGQDGVDMNVFESPLPMSNAGFKPFPIARQGANAVAAFQRMLADGLDTKQIESIEVFVPAMNVALISRPLAAGDRLSLLCNMGFQLACAAIAPDMLYDPERSGGPGDKLIDFSKRVSVTAATDLDAYLPGRWPARVVVNCGTQEFQETVIAAPFDHDRPDVPQLLSNKWRRMLAPEDARELIEGQSPPAQLWQRIEARVRMVARPEG